MPLQQPGYERRAFKRVLGPEAFFGGTRTPAFRIALPVVLIGVAIVAATFGGWAAGLAVPVAGAALVAAWSIDRRRAVRATESDARVRLLEQAVETQYHLLQAAPVAQLQLVDGRIAWANARLEEILGASPQVLIGRRIEDLFVDDGEFRTVRRQALVQLRRTGRAVGEAQVRGRDGVPEKLWFLGRPVDREDPAEGALWAVLGRADLIGDPKVVDLSESVFDNTSEGIVLTDADRTVLTVNPAFTDITGRSPEDVTGRSADVLFPDREGSTFTHRMWETVNQSGRWEGETWGLHKNGEVYPEWRTLLAVYDDDGALAHYLIMLRDITRRKEDEEKIRFRAFYDPLTGLPNRLLLQKRLREALVTAARIETTFALMYLDLDRFKVINDSLGHASGDLLLVEIGKRILDCLPDMATLARQGGDEFLALIPNTSAEGASALCRAIQDRVAEPLKLEVSDHDLVMTSSVGIALYPKDGVTAADLIRSADTAASQAKAQGRNSVLFFTEEMNAVAQERLDLENRLRRALQDEDFTLHFQPKVDLRTGRVSGAEALIRWPTPGGEVITPDRFIPIAEETGMIVALGQWVLLRACHQMREWQEAGFPPFTVAVNLSPRQLREGNFLSLLGRVLSETKLDPRFLELEITEQTIFEQLDEAVRVFADLRAMGIRLTVDDFGTGYSSLSYLRDLPLDGLKIDRSFIADIEEARDRTFLAGAVVAIGQSLGLKVTAEGVETEYQLGFLRQQWCDEIQGYYFSRPVPPDEFIQIVKQDRRLSRPTA